MITFIRFLFVCAVYGQTNVGGCSIIRALYIFLYSAKQFSFRIPMTCQHYSPLRIAARLLNSTVTISIYMTNGSWREHFSPAKGCTYLKRFECKVVSKTRHGHRMERRKWSAGTALFSPILTVTFPQLNTFQFYIDSYTSSAQIQRYFSSAAWLQIFINLLTLFVLKVNMNKNISIIVCTYAVKRI